MFLKNKNIIFKIRRSKVTDYAALRYLRNKTLLMDGHTHTQTDNVKTVYPPQTKFAGGITIQKEESISA